MSENKERLIGPQIIEQNNRTTEIVDVQKNREEFKLPDGVEHWMRKLEQDPNITNQNNRTSNNVNDDSVLQPIATGVTQIVLPTDRKTFSEGLKDTVDQAKRWFTEFWFRNMKINILKGNKVKFNEE